MCIVFCSDQDKLGELQALVMQLLGERNMLHSYTEESRLTPTPAQQQQHELEDRLNQHRLANGVAGQGDNGTSGSTGRRGGKLVVLKQI